MSVEVRAQFLIIHLSFHHPGSQDSSSDVGQVLQPTEPSHLLQAHLKGYLRQNLCAREVLLTFTEVQIYLEGTL